MYVIVFLFCVASQVVDACNISGFRVVHVALTLVVGACMLRCSAQAAIMAIDFPSDRLWSRGSRCMRRSCSAEISASFLHLSFYLLHFIEIKYRCVGLVNKSDPALPGFLKQEKQLRWDVILEITATMHLLLITTNSSSCLSTYTANISAITEHRVIVSSDLHSAQCNKQNSIIRR
jgi:hypothetical protein